MKQATWEEAVRWYRAQTGNEQAVRDNYFDVPVRQAAERYARSEEFAETIRLLGSGAGREILDLGAGNGIASFALAQHGWLVTALEPDASDEVGAGAIRLLAEETRLPIIVVQSGDTRLPFQDKQFDAVHVRQALHHVPDIEASIQDLSRVLRAGGLLLATREHVADDEGQLKEFRRTHELHHLYGGENAYPLARYLAAFAGAGLRVREVWGPFESVLNFYPGTEAERQKTLRQIANRSYFRLGRLLAWHATFRAAQLKRFTERDRTPGRIYSFLLEKS